MAGLRRPLLGQAPRLQVTGDRLQGYKEIPVLFFGCYPSRGSTPASLAVVKIRRFTEPGNWRTLIHREEAEDTEGIVRAVSGVLAGAVRSVLSGT